MVMTAGPHSHIGYAVTPTTKFRRWANVDRKKQRCYYITSLLLSVDVSPTSEFRRWRNQYGLQDRLAVVSA